MFRSIPLLISPRLSRWSFLPLQTSFGFVFSILGNYLQSEPQLPEGFLKKDQKRSNSKDKIADESTRVSSYTPQQAIPEMLAFQKKFKQNFDCENWQNLAQGPFRREILENKIKSKKEFLSNSFIKQRYELHQKVFDEQINSDIGEEFFSILNSVLYTN